MFLLATGELVDRLVDVTPCSADESIKGESQSKKRGKGKRKKESAKEDACMSMLGLLLLELNDAVREGNGNQICRCLQFFLPLFKATK